jgi:hypothetical protein
MNKVLQFPGIITSVNTKIDCVKVSVETSGFPAPEHSTELLRLHHTGIQGWFTFSQHEIQPEDLLNLPKLPRREGRSKAERLRAVLYRYWEQDTGGFDNADSHYDSHMEKFIDHVKGKLT